ncbi:hypothetical protein AVEN_206007-2-1, partial [Araneus ventricosus]
GGKYLIFLQQILTELFEEHAFQSLSCAQYDSIVMGPTHFTHDVQPHFIAKFEYLWIKRRGRIIGLLYRLIK